MKKGKIRFWTIMRYILLAVLIIGVFVFIVTSSSLIPFITRASISIILFGAFLNYLVVSFNGFKMPVFALNQGIKKDIVKEDSSTHFPFMCKERKKIRLFLLSDIIYIVIPIKMFPMVRVMSVGDYVISIGLISLVATGIGVLI